jgi:two-component system LytT family sensor kinase
LRELQHLGPSTQPEDEYLENAAEVIARFLHAPRFFVAEERGAKTAWAEAVVPLSFSRGDTKYLMLGPRNGGRRYLSEDLAVLARLAAVVVEHVEQLRGAQMQTLVSQAELRALQAQINPHFLFNSLNTLYGSIDRSNAEARRLVLNLSDVFRYFLRLDRPFIQVEEEIRIVRAYLEIEELRLGPKLRAEIDIDPSALHATIPALSIQPLVENAIKHGVANRTGQGFVRLTVRREFEAIAVRVANSGECDARRITGGETGVGLTNVRRRLALCYGEETRIEVNVQDNITSVGFVLPMKQAAQVPALV